MNSNKLYAIATASFLMAICVVFLNYDGIAKSFGTSPAVVKVVVSCILALAMVTFFLWIIAQNKITAANVAYIENFLKYLADGGYAASTYTDCQSENISEDNVALTDLISHQLVQFHKETSHLSSIVAGIECGIIALNSSEVITFINNFALKILGLDISVFGKNKTAVDKLKLLDSDEIELNNRFYKITITKIFEYNSNYGTIIMLSDITDAKRYEKMRTDFVSNVTHELKTPLTSIQGFADTLLEDENMNPKTVRHFLGIIHVESVRLCELIDGILLLQRLDSISEFTELDKMPAICPAQMAVEVCQLAAQNKKIRLELVNNCGELNIMASLNPLKQLLINLISNAINYNKDFGVVRVVAETHGCDLIYKVMDTGIGLTASNIARMFERFYRVDKGRSRLKGGTGLGLSIVKHIVNIYNGKIDVQSKYGQWTCVTVTLPIVIED